MCDCVYDLSVCVCDIGKAGESQTEQGEGELERELSQRERTRWRESLRSQKKTKQSGFRQVVEFIKVSN